jgi:hypothetical protein
MWVSFAAENRGFKGFRVSKGYSIFHLIRVVMVFVACGENGVDRASGQLGKLLNLREIGLESRANSVERGRKTDIRFYAVYQGLKTNRTGKL